MTSRVDTHTVRTRCGWRPTIRAVKMILRSPLTSWMWSPPQPALRPGGHQGRSRLPSPARVGYHTLAAKGPRGLSEVHGRVRRTVGGRGARRGGAAKAGDAGGQLVVAIFSPMQKCDSSRLEVYGAGSYHRHGEDVFSHARNAQPTKLSAHQGLSTRPDVACALVC